VGRPAAPTTEPIGSDAADASVAGAGLAAAVVEEELEDPLVALGVAELVELEVDGVAAAVPVGDGDGLDADSPESPP
jgi:hypothetical protein